MRGVPRQDLSQSSLTRHKKNNRRGGKAIIGAEHTSDEDSEDEEKVVGVAGLDLSDPGHSSPMTTPTTTPTTLTVPKILTLVSWQEVF
jgi:hypothetical protein